LSDVVCPKGEFARAYIVESQFEGEIFGRKQTFVLSCFNDRAVKRRPLTHDFSHKGRIQKMPEVSSVRKEPYRIGGFQVFYDVKVLQERGVAEKYETMFAGAPTGYSVSGCPI
jgi:hypothetical protein